MSDVISTLTAPIRLAGRTLDDVHTLANASGDAVEREERWADAIDALQQRIEEQRDATRESTKRQAELVAQLKLLGGRLDVILEKVEAVEGVLPDRQKVVAEVERIRGEVSTLAAAAQPMGEAAGRVERIASHLPGGRS